MDPTIIILSLSVIVFGVLPLLFRSSAALIFLTLCAGELLARLTAQDATQFVMSIPNASSLPLYSIVQIVLLVIPPLIVLFAYKHTQSSSNILIGIVPAIASILVCAMLVVAKLPYDTKITVENSSLYSSITPFFSLAVAAGLMATTFYLVFTKKSKTTDKKSKAK